MQLSIRRLLAFLLLLCWAGFPLLAWRSPAAAETKVIRVTVLPFMAPADDKQLLNYAQGVTQTLISALAHVPKFVVVHEVWVENILNDHGVKFAEGGNLEPEVARKVGTWLEAQTLITGHLLRAGDQVRLTANVIDLVTGHTDVEALTGRLAKIFDLMDNLAHRVATSHNVNLTPELRQRMEQSSHPTTQLTAFEYYILGKHAYQLATPIGFKDAIDWFHKTIGQDPDFAQAYAGLADAYASWGKQREVNGQESRSYYDRAREYAIKAVKLRPELLETHRALAHVYEYLGLTDEAQAQVYLALAINLHDAEALYRLWKLTAPENPDDPNLLSALALDPGLITARNDRGIAYARQGNLDAAIREYQAVLKVVPRKANTHYNLGLIYKKQQRWKDALGEFKASAEIMPDDPDSQFELGEVLSRQGQNEDAAKAFERLLQLKPDHPQARQLRERIQQLRKRPAPIG